MKKMLRISLICIMLCFLLAACKGKGVKTSDGSGPKNSLASQEEKETDEPDTDKEEEKEKKKKKRVPVSGKDESDEKDDNETDYEDIYAPVLDEARDMIKNGNDFDGDYKYPSTGLMERAMYPGDDDLSKVIGYYYNDFNGDGIPELLIGENDEDEYGNNPNDVAYIYNGYTCKDGEPVCFLEGWGRNRQHYLGEGHFFNTGSSGAMNTAFGEWHLDKGGTEQIWDDFYFSLEDMIKGGMAFYHNTTGNEDTDESERLKMTEDEFMDISVCPGL